MRSFRDRVAVVTGAVPAQPEIKGAIAIRAQDLLELCNPTLRRG